MASIPSPVHNIHKGNNKLHYIDNDQTLCVIAIDPGHYNSSTLMEELRTQMNKKDNQDYMIHYDYTAHYFTISSNKTFKILNNNNDNSICPHTWLHTSYK